MGNDVHGVDVVHFASFSQIARARHEVGVSSMTLALSLLTHRRRFAIFCSPLTPRVDLPPPKHSVPRSSRSDPTSPPDPHARESVRRPRPRRVDTRTVPRRHPPTLCPTPHRTEQQQQWRPLRDTVASTAGRLARLATVHESLWQSLLTQVLFTGGAHERLDRREDSKSPLRTAFIYCCMVERIRFAEAIGSRE